jgi:hypothetical protein
MFSYIMLLELICLTGDRGLVAMPYFVYFLGDTCAIVPAGTLPAVGLAIVTVDFFTGLKSRAA